ncbi:hypothetical protein [Paenibacillus ehimensis]|uniref:Uncharacterized protein n=1 Tax=Paenibacillus ehimensis TaxID=79264 RepID=A0ABT8V2S6_9BACL|nr:hypothetical protein [Paenibacillus ehimensis]MDO3675720.1 hypothetical protein [Paenibacillus ehimensis]
MPHFFTIDEGTRLSGEPRLAGYAYILTRQSPPQACAAWKRGRTSPAAGQARADSRGPCTSVPLVLVRRMKARTHVACRQIRRGRTVAILAPACR